MAGAKIRVEVLGGTASGSNPTGSCLLLEIRQGKNLNRILIDAGMWQGNGNGDTNHKNIFLPKQLHTIDLAIITHAHADHGGKIPFFVRHGFQGKIFCTKATAEILPSSLGDTASILQKELAQKRKRIQKSGKKKTSKQNEIPFFYHKEDVEKTLGLIKAEGFSFYRWIKLDKGIFLKFYPSGHVLGGALVVLRIDQDKSLKNPIYLGFSGDLGRDDGKILPPPALIKEPLDYWFTEGTYGGTNHPPSEKEIKKLLEIVQEASKGFGKIFIPSFALERAQELVHLLSLHMTRGEIPPMPIILDSPLARKITTVFSEHWKEGLFKDQNQLSFNPFDPEENPYFRLTETYEDSTELSKKFGPAIIIAGSGMCDYGRIRNHFKMDGLSNHNNNVLLVGFMAEGTLGLKLKKGFAFVRMNGDEIPVRAKIHSFESFSAHADGKFLVRYASQLTIKKGIFILHGDAKRASWLKRDLGWKLENKIPIIIPSQGEILNLS